MAVNAVAARVVTIGGLAVALSAVAAVPQARADSIAYLVNATVRPGYHFPNADAALAYGYGICDKVGAGRGYSQLIGDSMADFATADSYQAVYIINQAVNELCPAMIWQLRQSAAHYTGQPNP